MNYGVQTGNLDSSFRQSSIYPSIIFRSLGKLCFILMAGVINGYRFVLARLNTVPAFVWPSTIIQGKREGGTETIHLIGGSSQLLKRVFDS